MDEQASFTTDREGSSESDELCSLTSISSSSASSSKDIFGWFSDFSSSETDENTEENETADENNMRESATNETPVNEKNTNFEVSGSSCAERDSINDMAGNESEKEDMYTSPNALNTTGTKESTPTILKRCTKLTRKKRRQSQLCCPIKGCTATNLVNI